MYEGMNRRKENRTLVVSQEETAKGEHERLIPRPHIRCSRVRNRRRQMPRRRPRHRAPARTPRLPNPRRHIRLVHIHRHARRRARPTARISTQVHNIRRHRGRNPAHAAGWHGVRWCKVRDDRRGRSVGGVSGHRGVGVGGRVLHKSQALQERLQGHDGRLFVVCPVRVLVMRLSLAVRGVRSVASSPPPP